MARETSLLYYASKSRHPQPTFSVVDKSRRLFLLGVTALLALLIAGAIFYIGTHVKVVNLGYQISREILRKENLIEENKRLSLEIARLTSPTRIEREAVETLGLKMPQAGQILYLQNLGDPTALAKFIPNASKAPIPLPTPTKDAGKEKKPSLTDSSSKGLVMKSSTAKKESPKVLIAKIVESPDPPKVAPTKSSKVKLVSLQTKEAVPAVMLDPMP